MPASFKGPYTFGNQVAEPFKGPYTFGEDGLTANGIHANAPVLSAGVPAGRTVSFTVVDGEPAFALDYKDGFREGLGQRIFDHTFLAAGTFIVGLTDARGRTTTVSVTVA